MKKNKKKLSSYDPPMQELIKLATKANLKDLTATLAYLRVIQAMKHLGVEHISPEIFIQLSDEQAKALGDICQIYSQMFYYEKEQGKGQGKKQ